jgi:hypothetical protein
MVTVTHPTQNQARPGGEPCRRCGHIYEYRNMRRVTIKWQKRPVWLCPTCEESQRRIGRIK